MSLCIKCGISISFIGVPESKLPEDSLCLWCERDGLKAALLKVYSVASGEFQVADDDTGGMKWIADFVRHYLPNDGVKAQVEGCGDCDPCLGGRPDQCALTAKGKT